MSNEIAEAFTELFYGSGAWLGLLLYLTIIISLTYIWKKSGVFFIPVTVILGIQYFNNDLGWHSLIMWLTTIMIFFQVMKGD